MEEPQPEMAATTTAAAATTTTTTTTTTTINNSDSEASLGRSSPASQHSDPGSRAAPDVAAALPEAPAAATAGSSRRRRAADWEIMQGLRTGQRCDDKPRKFEGYLLKRRKWPLKGWHKRFFCLEKGILTYAKSSTDMAKGKNHGSVDLGLSVISTKSKGRRIDIDAEEFIYHLKVKNQAQFQQWVSQLQHHRLYRQHEITFGSREAPKMTSPAAEDSGTLPGANGPSGALTLCSCSPNDSSTCRRHHCYRELMLSARTCTQGGFAGSVLGAQGSSRTCRCFKISARDITAGEIPEVDTAASFHLPSTSASSRDLEAVKKEVASGVIRGANNCCSMVAATCDGSNESPLALCTSERASEVSPTTSKDIELKLSVEASDDTAQSSSVGRGAITCGIDTDTLVVTFYPALGSNFSDSMAHGSSTEDLLSTHIFDELLFRNSSEVQVDSHREVRRNVSEEELFAADLNSLVTHHGRNFVGLQRLRQGTNVGVSTEPDVEVVEREHNTRVKIVGHTHPRMLLKGRKRQPASGPTPQVIVGTLSVDELAVVQPGHSRKVGQSEISKQNQESRLPLNGSRCGKQNDLKTCEKEIKSHLFDCMTLPGVSSSKNAENLATCKFSQPTLASLVRRPSSLILPLDLSDKSQVGPVKGEIADCDEAVSIGSLAPQLALRQTVQNNDAHGVDLSLSLGSRWCHDVEQTGMMASLGGGIGMLNERPSQKKEEFGLNWLLDPVQSSDDLVEGIDTKPAASETAPAIVAVETAAQAPGSSHSGLMTRSQSGLSSTQYCTALPEQSGSELRNNLQTFLFLHSDSSFFDDLQCTPTEITKFNRVRFDSCPTYDQSSERSA